MRASYLALGLNQPVQKGGHTAEPGLLYWLETRHSSSNRERECVCVPFVRYISVELPVIYWREVCNCLASRSAFPAELVHTPTAPSIYPLLLHLSIYIYLNILCSRSPDTHLYPFNMYISDTPLSFAPTSSPRALSVQPRLHSRIYNLFPQYIYKGNYYSCSLYKAITTPGIFYNKYKIN